MDEHADRCLPPIRQRAALPEAAAQSVPIHSLPPRPGAAESAGEFDVLYSMVVLGHPAPSDDDEPEPIADAVAPVPGWTTPMPTSVHEGGKH